MKPGIVFASMIKSSLMIIFKYTKPDIFRTNNCWQDVNAGPKILFSRKIFEGELESERAE